MGTELDKEMAYLKGFLKGKGFSQALMALQYAKICHEGQVRRTGEPYIMHPVRVCNTLASLGVYDDNTLAVALLHDVVEDCKVSITALSALGFNGRVVHGVDCLTKKAGQTTEEYYDILMGSAHDYVLLPKLCDRSHNVSTMAGAFGPEKIKSYIFETEAFVYALFGHAKKVIPQYSEELFVMKYNIESLIKAYKLFLDTFEAGEAGDSNGV